MDGAIMGAGGGFELGAGYVTLGVEMGAVHDGVAHVERMVADLVGKEFVLRPTIDLTSARQAVAQFQQEVQQALAAFVLPGGTPTSAVAGMMQQLQSLQGINAVGGAAAPAFAGGGSVVNHVTYNITNNAVTGGSGGMPGPGGGGGGGGSRGGSSRPWWMVNPSRPGELFRQLGAPVAAYYGIEAAGEIAHAEHQVTEIAARPDVQLNELSYNGSGFELASNPTVQRIATESNALEQELVKRKTMNSLPLVGHLFKAFDYGDESQESLEQRIKDNASLGASIKNAADLEYAVRRQVAATSGDRPTQLRIEQSHTLQAAREKAAEAETLVDNFVRAHQEVLIQDSTSPDNANFQRYMDLKANSSVQGKRVDQLERSQQADAARADAQQAVEQADRVISNQGQFFQLRAQQLVAQSDVVLAGGGIGSIDAARQLRQQAERQQVTGGFEVAMGTSSVFGLGTTLAKYGAQAQALSAGQGAENTQTAEQRDREQTQVEARGQAARYEQLHNHFAAEIVLFEANASAEIEISRRKGQGILHATQEYVNSERQLMFQHQVEAGQDIVAGAGLSIAASRDVVAGANFEMQQNPHAASMLQFDGEQRRIDDARRQARRLPAVQQGIEMAKLDSQENANNARRQNAEFQYTRNLSLQSFELSARDSAATLAIANEPLAAQATMEIARAREAIAAADPKLRPQLIATEGNELRAMLHSQFGFRSGAMSQAYTLDEALGATGFGMDLGGNARDRRAAQGIINGGIGQLGNAIPGTAPQALNDAATNIANAAALLKQALTRVTLFTSGS